MDSPLPPLQKTVNFIGQTYWKSKHHRQCRTNLSLDRIALAMNDGVRRHDAVWRRVCLDHLEFHRPHPTAHEEDVSLVQWPIGLQEVWFEIDVKQVSTHME